MTTNKGINDDKIAEIFIKLKEISDDYEMLSDAQLGTRGKVCISGNRRVNNPV